MTDFVSNLINKFKKTAPPDDPIIMIKPDNKNLVSSDSILLNEPARINVYSLKEVKVDKDGDITGDIHSKSCVVNGRVNGNILSVDSIEIKNTAIIEGNIKSGSIQIEAGSIINGFISIEKKIKLPSISATSAETVSNNSLNRADVAEGGYITVKTAQSQPASAKIKPEGSEVKKTLTGIKGQSAQAAVKTDKEEAKKETIQIEVPKIGALKPETKEEPANSSPKTPEIIPQPAEKEENNKSSAKKPATDSSNDSWW